MKSEATFSKGNRVSNPLRVLESLLKEAAFFLWTAATLWPLQAFLIYLNELCSLSLEEESRWESTIGNGFYTQ